MLQAGIDELLHGCIDDFVGELVVLAVDQVCNVST